ncbi:MAG: O-antigen ligase family protein [Thermoanaerobaculia bacterium]|nr:O-antigen ligase family protein [Thermoanaerobaculia bacterium]MBP7814160.1 O-antigen ligase family protein [Thermoanaerobaculia bacterium]HPA95417.1 O-antigen ligase family protein [Thermoanaerobaculia bacterium]HRR13899.1 O-antigen ligase family protein [Thermoanaerobaculia bacterium]HRU08986.1 O-antigen ligase family protein [Thermoanaerobaculia bacterium]
MAGSGALVSPAPNGRRERWAFALCAAPLATLFGIALSNFTLAVAALALPWIARGRRGWLARGQPVLAAAALYCLFLVAAVAASAEPARSLREVGELFSLGMLPLALLALRGEREVRRLVDILAVAGTAFALHGLTQYLFGYGDLDRRIRGPFSHWMTFSGVLLVIDLLLVAQAVLPSGGPEERGRFWRTVRHPASRATALVLVNLALAGSLTRSAWVAVLVAVLTLVVGRAPRLLSMLLPAALVVLLLAPVPWVARALSIGSLRDASNYDRLCMLTAGARMVSEKPLLGIGPGLVRERYPIYRDATAPRIWVPHLHNSYMQIAAERGLLSLTALVALLGTGFLEAWRGLRCAEREGRGPADLHLGVAAALVAFAVAGLFEHNWGDTEVQRVVLAVLALPFCLREVG